MKARLINGVPLILASFLGLFYELLLIRWLPAHVLSIAYFSNIVLIACFLGLGIGLLLAKKMDTFPLFPALVLALTGLFVSFQWFEVLVPTGQNEWIWSGYRGNQLDQTSLQLGILPTLSIVFVLSSLFFVPLGQKVGEQMSLFSPLHGYSLNVMGSLLGIILFSLLSTRVTDLNGPAVWFGVGGLVTLWFFRNRRMLLLLAIVCTLGTCGLVHYNSKGELWSPYYSIRTLSFPDGSLSLFVNRFFHQRMINFEREPHAKEKYSIPYRLNPPRRLLILGAGTGNDAAIARMYQVAHIDAVEIDPVVAKLGAWHPFRPYSHPDTHLIIDDARSFLRKTDSKYDMVVLGTLDSHALLSGMTTVRLDNFVYTREALQDIRRVLKNDGTVVLLFSVPLQWMADKLIRLCLEVFPHPPPLIHAGDDYLFNLMVVAGPGVLEKFPLSAQKELHLYPIKGMTSHPTLDNIPTDDWPYLYLKDRSIPQHYLEAIILLVAVSSLALWIFTPIRRGKPQWVFLNLGCAFMLLETKSVTSLSLLFGSTWIVNSFVFAFILIMILLANCLISRLPLKRAGGMYVLLFLTILLNYALSPNLFLSQGFWMRSILSSLFVALPLLFAGVIFAYHLRSTPQPEAALGYNLLGAVLGGFLEYTAMIVGLNKLHLLAVTFYMLAYLTTLGFKSLPKSLSFH